jgi:hypothetical protein
VTSSVYGIPLQPAVFKRTASAFLTDARQQRGHLKRVQAGSSIRQIVLASATTDSGNQVVNTFERGSGGCATNCQDDIRVLDGNGNELWCHSILGGEMGFALHPSGIVYILQADYNNNSTFTLFAFDELTGAQKFSIVLPFSFGGQLQPFPGLPSVLPDGNLYLPVETIASAGSPDVLQLLKVAPDGTYSWYPVITIPSCGGPAIEAHEPLPDGQGNILITWDYFGCNQIGVSVVRMSSSGQILGQYPLPLARSRLGSYFSDNDGDAVLGAQHLFVTDERDSAVGLNLSTGGIDLNWQSPGGPCTTFPCPQISLAGIAAGDQLLVDQTGNSDGSSTLFTTTPSSSSCSTTCITTSSVPNSTLVTFDFNGTAFSSTPGTSVSANQYFSVLPTPFGSSGTGSVGGAVTGPDTNTTPKPQQSSPWSAVAENSTRDGLIVVKVQVFTVIEANVPTSYIQDKLNTGIGYWQLHSRIRLTWDGKITSLPACDPNNPQCFIGNVYDISELASGGLPEIARRFPAPDKGIQILFIKFFLLGAVDSADGYTPTNVTNSVGLHNLVILRNNSNAILLAAHEIGHVFGLAHVYSIYNLMCGEQALPFGVDRLFFPCVVSGSANELRKDQLETAITNARKLAQ